MLCSTAVKSLVESAEKKSSMIVAYWYFDNADSQTQSLQRFLRLVLSRIAAKATPLPEALRNLTTKHEVAGSSPSIQELHQAVKQTVAGLGQDMFLVLDAVGEYQTGSKALRQELLGFLVNLANAELPKLHILVTSISDADIENVFRDLP